MDDEEVNCQIPQTPISGSTANVFYCDTLIRLAQLSSTAHRKVFSHQAFRNGVQALVSTLGDLNEQLAALKQSREHVLRLGEPIDPTSLPASLSFHQAMYLQYAYNITVLDVNTVLAIPWSQNLLASRREALSTEQVQNSTQLVAQTCRNMILATTSLNLDASTPHP